MHIDLCKLFPSGEYILGVVDECSLWPEAHRIQNITTGVVERFEANFATHGIPKTIVSENGRQFVSREFLQEFCKIYEISHRKISFFVAASQCRK